jgi:hypothetical protein
VPGERWSEECNGKWWRGGEVEGGGGKVKGGMQQKVVEGREGGRGDERGG